MTENIWALPPDLQKYTGWYDWEVQLSDKDRYRLAFTRSLIGPEDEEDFALNYADMHSGGEFRDALEDAGSDQAARAVVRLEAEIDSYPYRIDWDARTPAEMNVVKAKPR